MRYDLAYVQKLEAERDAALKEVERLREALEDMVTSAVEFEDERIKYVTMQIDKVTLDAARAALSGEPQ